MKITHSLILIFLSLSAVSATITSPEFNIVQDTIAKQQSILWNEVHNATWYYPPYLGEMFISEYYF